ncbi:MAG: PEP-CTERM sorting domain-containing protein [Phycisphaerales bacterium]
MTKFSALIVIVAAAGTAAAAPVLGDYSTYTQISAEQVTAVTLEQGVQGASNTVYSNMDAGSGYQAFPAGNGVLGFDDYTSTEAGPLVLQSLRFVGGVVADGGTLNFEFFNAAGDTFIDGFSVNLATGGNFIWTINLGGTVTVDGAGVLQVSTGDTSEGQWFLSDAGPTIGSEDNTFGGASGGALAHNFELNTIPAPGALAMLGLGGVVAGRRRR